MSALMEMAESDPNGAAGHLQRVYEWKHDRTTAISKALAGSSLAFFLAPLVPILAPSSDVQLSWWGVGVLWGSAVTLVITSAFLMSTSRKIEAEYLRSQSALANFVEIRPFLRLYRMRGQ